MPAASVKSARLAGRSRWLWLLLLAVPLVPLIDRNSSHINFLADAGAFILLALGLNIVIGFAGLLDLGYAAFSRSDRTVMRCSRARNSGFTYRSG